MGVLRRAALAAAIAMPGVLPAAADSFTEAQNAFISACIAGTADHGLCICILDRLAATIEERDTLGPALAGAVSDLPSHSDPRLADAFTTAVNACGGRLVVRKSEGG